MPKEIVSYQCPQCKTLFPSNGRHLLVTTLKAEVHAAATDSQWQKGQQLDLNLDQEAFCDEACLSQYVAEHLRFVK